jgi:hypothetical protein
MRSASAVEMNHRCLALTGCLVISTAGIGDRSRPPSTYAHSSHCQVSTNCDSPCLSTCHPLMRLPSRDRQRGHAWGKSSKYSSLVRGADSPPSRRRMRRHFTKAAASRMITARHITPATSATISIHQTAKLAIATDSSPRRVGLHPSCHHYPLSKGCSRNGPWTHGAPFLASVAYMATGVDVVLREVIGPATIH